MNRARLRLVTLLVLSGIASAVAATFYLCLAFALLTEGPGALLDGLRLGARVVHFGLVLATLPATLCGSLLWLRGIRSAIAWAGLGVLAGVACLGLACIGPGDIDQITRGILRHEPVAFSAAFAVGGALAALTFLALMRLLTRIARGRSPIRRA